MANYLGIDCDPLANSNHKLRHENKNNSEQIE